MSCSNNYTNAVFYWWNHIHPKQNYKLNKIVYVMYERRKLFCYCKYLPGLNKLHAYTKSIVIDFIVFSSSVVSCVLCYICTSIWYINKVYFKTYCFSFHIIRTRACKYNLQSLWCKSHLYEITARAMYRLSIVLHNRFSLYVYIQTELITATYYCTTIH